MMNRMCKWVAAGALLLGTVPAISWARPHAGIPLAAVTTTPVGMEAPIDVLPARSKIRHTKRAIKKHSKVLSRRHATRRHAARRSHHRVKVTRPAHKVTHHARKHLRRSAHRAA